MTLEDLRARWSWRPIWGCPGRAVLRGPPVSIEALAGDASVEVHRCEGARDEVLVVRLVGGGLISYRREDGSCVHTLNDAEGMARKLAQLGID